MDSIKKPIQPEPVTGFNRIAYHENFVIQGDLNMIQQVRIVALDENGVPIRERIEKDETMNPAQKQAALERYADQLVTRKTTGAFVDASGQVVEPTAEVAIPQREYFQAITLGDLKKMGLPISDKTPITTLIYALIGQEITNLDNRKAL